MDQRAFYLTKELQKYASGLEQRNTDNMHPQNNHEIELTVSSNKYNYILSVTSFT